MKNRKKQGIEKETVLGAPEGLEEGHLQAACPGGKLLEKHIGQRKKDCKGPG